MRHGNINIMVIVVPLFVILAGFAEAAPRWTEEDRKNIQHFFASRQADKAAVSISNRGGPFSPVSSKDTAEILRLRQEALHHALLLRDDVLAKAHPELPKKFRDLYQRSLELMIRAFQDRDNSASFRASQLHDQWVGWFNANKRKIKIPK